MTHPSSGPFSPEVLEHFTHPRDVAPPVHSPVRTLMLYLTEDCNLRCTYCYLAKRPRRMSSETARKAIGFFLDGSVSGGEYRLHICFFGGEPFLEMDRMEEVIALAREPRANVYKRFSFSATTNGTIADARVERIVRESRMRLLVSMDGGTRASTHRPFLSGVPSGEVVKGNLGLLASWSEDVVVRMTFLPETLDLVGNVRCALAAGAPAVALSPVLEADWRAHEKTVDAAYQHLADWYVEEAVNGKILPIETTNVLLRQYHDCLQGAPPVSCPCNVGSSQLAVDVEGNVMPCQRFLHRRQDWLGTVDEPLVPARRQDYLDLSVDVTPRCAACEARPVCGGGCRVVALDRGLGLRGVHDSFCITKRAHARAVARIHQRLSARGSHVLRRALRSPRFLNPPGELISR